MVGSLHLLHSHEHKAAPEPPKNLSEQQTREVLKWFDKNGDGRLNRQELKAAFAYLGAVVPAWRAFRGLNIADADGDGAIDEEELRSLITYFSRLGYIVDH